MEVFIWCGGLGTRLREETEYRPKPMVNIGPRPILWHIMKMFSHYGHTDYVLALGYKGDMIKQYFANYELMNCDVTVCLGDRKKVCLHNNHDEADWKVTLLSTGIKNLKGSRLKKAERFIKGDTFFATYGDGLADVNLEALLEFHWSHGKLVTLTGVSPTSRFGELKVRGNQVFSFREKPLEGKGGLVNGGFFVLQRSIFDYLDEHENCDFEIGPLEKIANEGQLMVYRHDGFWACMDTLRDMEYLNGLWDEGRAKWRVWKQNGIYETPGEGRCLEIPTPDGGSYLQATPGSRALG